MSYLSNPVTPPPAQGFYRARPQVLRDVIRTLDRAIAATSERLAHVSVREDHFTRQLLLDFERARDAAPGSPRYDITHQPELISGDSDGKLQTLRRLDLRVLFPRQIGRTGDYLCLECKYLDVLDRATDRAYVVDGVERIASGAYAKDHPWAIMVGLERTGPIPTTAANIDHRLQQHYGIDGGLKSPSAVKLPFVYQSEHLQGGGPHSIAILHSLHLIASHVEAAEGVPQ